MTIAEVIFIFLMGCLVGCVGHILYMQLRHKSAYGEGYSDGFFEGRMAQLIDLGHKMGCDKPIKDKEDVK